MEEAFGPALRKATGRAFSVQSWAMSLEKRFEQLQSRILPLLVYPARVIFPDENVISAVKTIYNIALKLNSRGITTDILSHPKDQGGVVLAPQNTFMLWQFSTLFVRHVHQTEAPPLCVTVPYERFAKEHGIVVTPNAMPLFQMASNVIWRNMPYLAWSARAFSIVSSKTPIKTPDLLAYDTPLWHNRLFMNPRLLTYFCPRLIRDRITTLASC